MDDLNGEYHEDFFMKDFLMEPSKPTRSMYTNNILHQQSQQHRQQQQQMQTGMMYGSNAGMCGVPNSNNYSSSNCYESNGSLDSLSLHNASNVGPPLVSPHFLPNLSSHLPGMQLNPSNVNLPGSSSRMSMSSNNLNMSSNSMGIPVQSQGALSMGLSGNNVGSNRIPYNSSNQYAGPSSSVMGLHPNSSMHTSASSNIPMHTPSSNSMGMHSNPPAGGMGLHASPSGSGLGIHPAPSPSGLGMHSSSATSSIGMHSAGLHSNSSSTMLPSASPSNRGMHSSASPSGMGMHSSASPSGMGMHSSASPSGMGMHSSASPSGMGMHSSASPSGMGMHSSASPSGMGMPSSASPSGMGMHSSASPSGIGMHPSASPSGMGICSNPSPALHSSASPGGMGMHSSASPAGMGMHSSMSSPAPSMGKPSASPSRSSLPVASPNVLNMQSTARSPMAASASRSPYQSSSSNFSIASPGCLSKSSTSPGRVNLPTTSPLNNQDLNGSNYSASCSEDSSPAVLERLAAERLPSGVTVSVTDRGEPTSQLRRTPPPQDVLTITPVEESSGRPGPSGTKKKKDITQVKKVRRKNSEESESKSKKRKAVREQVIGSDPRGEPGFGAPSLYDLLTGENPCEGSLLSVGEIPSGTANFDITTAQGTVKRGRKRKTGEGAPKASSKQRTTVTYQSQISSQNGIKLRIKKSEPIKKPVKQRVRKKKNKSTIDSDSDEGIHHRRVNHKAVSDSSDEQKEQSPWGTDALPKTILHRIFKYVSHDEGCVPFLVRMQRVCRQWREVAISPDLWHTIELCSTWVRDRAKNHHTFRWLCENRLTSVRELNLGGWKFSGIPALLDVIANNCVELRGLNLTGWQGLQIEHILFLVTNCQKLQKLDLSGVNPEAHNNKGAVSLSSVQHLTSVMGDRLTHLVLANNKLAGVPQIIMAIAGSCPNLQVLDMSSVRTVAHATAQIHIEKLQEGCTQLRVLRITNSQFALAPVTIKEQVESPGFPNLEELSVASPHGRMDSLATSQPFIDDDAIGRILKNSNKLRLLDVRGCSKITDSSLVRIPAWDLEHLYLSGCYATRIPGSGLELITQKWGHSLVELDLAWSSATEALDLAVNALAEVPERGCTSPLRILNLCGSSVSLEPVKAVLLNCLNLFSLNLASCRALPRGMKRHYEGIELVELRSQYEDKPREVKAEDSPPEPSKIERVENASSVYKAGRSTQSKAQNEVKSEPEADSDPDVNPNEESEEEAEEEQDEQGPNPDLDSDLEDESDTAALTRNHDSDRKTGPSRDSHSEPPEASGVRRDSSDHNDEALSYSEPDTPSSVYEEPDRLKTEPTILQDSISHQTLPSEAPRLDDIEVMTPEDLQMMAEALANTPDADRIAAAAEAEAGMTPTGRSTPIAASSTPHSGTYSDAGTPGPAGTLSEAGTPGQSGTLSEAGTPGPSGTESGTPGTPGTATTSGTTPQQGTDGDGELLALAQDVKYSLDNHLNFSFSELDCGASLQ